VGNVKTFQLSQTKAKVGLPSQEGPEPGIVLDMQCRLEESANRAARMPTEDRMVALADPVDVENAAK
jgi:hypothetical protein